MATWWGEDNTIILLDTAGDPIGTNKADPADWSAGETVRTYGSSTDLWGYAWTAAEINDTEFGLGLVAAAGGSGSGDAYVDYVTIEIYYEVPGGGTLSMMGV